MITGGKHFLCTNKMVFMLCGVIAEQKCNQNFAAQISQHLGCYLVIVLRTTSAADCGNAGADPIIAFPVLQPYERRHQLLSMLSEYSKSRAPFWR